MRRDRILRTLRYLDNCRDVVSGIDLGHPRKRSTGVCFYSEDSDRYIVLTVSPVEALSLLLALRDRVKVVAIDAPLSLPRRGIERDLERYCRRLGLRLIPPLLGPMRRLTICGICIKDVLEKLDMKVIETHPSSCLKISKIGREEILKILEGRILSVEALDRHGVDALICCLVALAYLKRMQVELKVGEDSLILFDNRFIEWLRRERR
ncbi:MAG: DUF429 domain-containing protein [Crenarchaeota archaeon]|nr:DUF429 domain-containing protein [Thermoproteota archaeon]